MVLALLPLFDDLSGFTKESETLAKPALTAIGQCMIHDSVINIDQIARQLETASPILDIVLDIDDISVDQQIQLLDAGAAKVVVSKDQLSELTDVPAERIIARLSEDQLATPAGIEEIADRVSGVIVNSTYSLSVDPESLKSIVKSLRKSVLPSGVEKAVYLHYTDTTPVPTTAELKSLALLSICPILSASYLTSDPKQNSSLLSVAQIALLGAKTDRPDGLYTTVVVDEHGVALGLVYSSTESIAETIRTGTGVYQSRQRGLWYKGATSGATQEIVAMDWDCDSDCLRFTVKQTGKGLSGFLTL
jgi:phosphoribosyl-AMP cyclohydrolase